ncbi:unnamed protein product [Litomosoides sigmodontis]|uniref:Uncharacterized protein n=1 Tax=Litomosoides sigmodontis TaxID=42156 RepID=A0A3P6ULC6_LITSI|nr:unnamed protein product [Litomosoides sigmodontis]
MSLISGDEYAEEEVCAGASPLLTCTVMHLKQRTAEAQVSSGVGRGSHVGNFMRGVTEDVIVNLLPRSLSSASSLAEEETEHMVAFYQKKEMLA